MDRTAPTAHNARPGEDETKALGAALHARIPAPSTARSRAFLGLIACLVLTLLAGCGSGGGSTGTTIGETSPPAPFTRGQKLDEKGAELFVTDGCSACHQISKDGVGPSLDSLPAHRVRLRDGRRVLVDEAFLRQALEEPQKDELAGYDPQPMLTALRVHPLSHAEETAIAAFIEELGPEAEPE